MLFHPPLLHVAAAALPAAAGLAVASHFRPRLREASAIVLYIATVGAVLASVTGLVDHLPYEGSPLLAHIEVHQLWGLGTTALAALASTWRWTGRWRGQDPVERPIFLVLMCCVLVATLAASSYGGDLVYTHGVGVQR